MKKVALKSLIASALVLAGPAHLGAQSEFIAGPQVALVAPVVLIPDSGGGSAAAGGAAAGGLAAGLAALVALGLIAAGNSTPDTQ